MAVFATVVSGDQHAGLDRMVDAWFAAWAETDPAKRQAQLKEAVTADIRFADCHGCINSLEGRDRMVVKPAPAAQAASGWAYTVPSQDTVSV